MRACTPVALVLLAASASFGLTGCAAIDELREAFLRWVESEKLPTGAGDLPDAAPTIPPEKPLQERSSQALKKTKKAARKPPQPQIIALPREKPPIPDSSEATRPEGTEGQSAPSPPTPPQLPNRWPPAPPPGRFSR
jgi:hypothetical protein